MRHPSSNTVVVKFSCGCLSALAYPSIAIENAWPPLRSVKPAALELGAAPDLKEEQPCGNDRAVQKLDGVQPCQAFEVVEHRRSFEGWSPRCGLDPISRTCA
jgi:hypothetical protein